MDDESTLWNSVYGDRDGRWLVLIGQVGGVMSPPRIADLQHLGPTWEVFTKLYLKFQAESTSREALQQRIADIAGVSQRSVSNYINGDTVPLWDSVDWAAVVRALFAEAGDPS